MSRLLACLVNDPLRLACALHPSRALLAAGPDEGAFGLGFYQGGEVLLQRRPAPTLQREARAPVDLYDEARNLRTDTLVASLAAAEASPARPEDTAPFRYRSWLGALHGSLGADEATSEAVLRDVPDFLRQNLRGRGAAERVFHRLLASIHAEGRLEDASVPVSIVARAVGRALRELALSLPEATPLDFALTNGRVLVVSRIGDPVWLAEVRGVRGCPVCRDQPALVSGARTTDHDHLRAVILVATPPAWSPPLPASAPYRLVPDRSLVCVSRELRVDVQPLYSAD